MDRKARKLKSKVIRRDDRRDERKRRIKRDNMPILFVCLAMSGELQTGQCRIWSNVNHQECETWNATTHRDEELESRCMVSSTVVAELVSILRI